MDSLQTALKNYNAIRTEANKTSYNTSDSNLVNILNTLSRELFNAGNCTKAKQVADDALAIAQKINFKKGTANAYHIIGITYHYRSNFPDALKNNFKAQ